MKKIVLYAFVLSASLLSLPSFADDGKATAGLGIEAFHDRYREPSLDVYTRSSYGSVTGYYSYEKSHVFGALDGRTSYGTTDYKSPSGSESGVPEWEFELRGRVGYSFNMWGGSLSPYTGIGNRYFMQEGKNRFTTLFAVGYDRRIYQAYLPLGVSYAYTTPGGWTITPQLEYDWLLYGHVNSRLTNAGVPDANISNKQTDGYGVRGELMFGKAGTGYSWQIGPFARYWSIKDSDVACTTTICGLEPKNDRIQAGLAARILW